MHILLLHHPFDKDIRASTIIQCTGHIVLDVYSKGQKSLLQKFQVLVSGDAQKCLRCHMEWWVQWTMMTAFWHFIWHLRHFWASPLINTWNFWSKLFWPLIYTSNTMCPVHCMMVLALISLSNGWCKSKICIHYHCVNIRLNSLGVMQTILIHDLDI